MTKLHAGSGIPHGTLHKGTKPQPAPYHAGSGAPKGVVHDASAPKPSQRTTSWHAMAAASQKRK